MTSQSISGTASVAGSSGLSLSAQQTKMLRLGLGLVFGDSPETLSPGMSVVANVVVKRPPEWLAHLIE